MYYKKITQKVKVDLGKVRLLRMQRSVLLTLSKEDTIEVEMLYIQAASLISISLMFYLNRIEMENGCS